MKHFFKMPNMKLRRCTTWIFFGIVTLFCIITIGFFILCLKKTNISIRVLMNPLSITFLLYILCVILAFAVSYLFFHKILHPLSELSNASKEIGKGNYTVRLDCESKIEEMQNVIKNFNAMAERLDSVKQMQNDFIANVSHEFKTPLSSVNGYVMLLQDGDLTAEERTEYIQKAFFNLEKLNQLVENILHLSKLEHQTYLEPPVSYRLDEQIREAIVILEPKWNAKQIEFALELEDVVYRDRKSVV